MGWLRFTGWSVALAVVLLLAPSGPAFAQLGDALMFPKTLVDRAIEARSMGDIAKDNEIVLKVNRAMAAQRTIKASTRIYEQRLLVTGLFDDKSTYDKFEKDVRAIPDVKTLYWHVIYMPKEEQERRKLLDWSDVLLLETKAEGRLIGTLGVADVNFRIAADAFGTLYLLGRGRSNEELFRARAKARDDGKIKKLVDYTVLRP